MNDCILDVSDLKKNYGDLQAVDGLSFSIARGEIFGLLGPNGAGKSTTISILSGLIKPSSGKISILGMDISQKPNAVKARLGLVPQDLALYQTLSARDNLLFFGQIYGLHGKDLNNRVDEVLEMVQLTSRAKEPVQKYSGGMKRRVNMAVGLLHRPDILFLDEPTVGVDPQSRNAIFESVEALNRAGLTIIYTTHYMEEAQRLCCRIAIVDHGQMVALDTPANLVRSVGGGLICVEINPEKTAFIAEKVKSLPVVSSVRISHGQLNVQAHESQKALTGLLDITNQYDTRINALQIFEPNLETVFLSLTGKRLRE
jgi:ABC-2 type transport system ATP-binding protein